MYKLYLTDTSCDNLDYSRLPQDLLYLSNKKPDSSLSKAGMLLALDALDEFNALPLKYLVSGKPVSSRDDVYLSISHTNTIAVCAVSNKPVGVDVEAANRPISQRVVSRFSAHEREIAERSAVDRVKIWIAKEALAKCEDIGITKAIDIDIVGKDGSIGVLGYSFSFVWHENYIISICVKQ